MKFYSRFKFTLVVCVRFCLVHKDGSEGAEKGKISKLKDIKSIDVIERILNGLCENYTK